MDRLIHAGEALFAAMTMQERRETEEFHIPQPTAKYIWDVAKEEWSAALIEYYASKSTQNA